MKRCLILVFVLVLSLAGTAPAYMWWDNDSGDGLWSNPLNWNEGEEAGYGDDILPDGNVNVALIGGVDKVADDVHILIDGTMTTALGTAAIARKLFINRYSVRGTIWEGNPFASAPATVTVDGGDLIINNDHLRLGSAIGDYGILELKAGSISVNNDGIKLGQKHLQIGEHGIGVFNMSGGTVLALDLQLSYDDGQGYMNMSDGLITLNDDFQVAHKENSIGTLVMTGGEIAANGSFALGRRGIGTIIMSGGKISHDSSDFNLAVDPTGVASLVMSGDAEIYVNDDMSVADDGGKANVLMTGGLLYIADDFRVPNGTEAGTQGTVQLYGGTIDTKILSMHKAREVDVIGWIDFHPDGLLLIRNEYQTFDEANPENNVLFTEYVQGLIDDDLLMTTYAGGVAWFDDLYGYPDNSALEIGYDFGITVPDVTAVYLIPEPATIALLGLGLVALRRKKRVS